MQLWPGYHRVFCHGSSQYGARTVTTATTATLTVGSSTVSPVSSVRDLDIFVDSDLVMRTHVCQTVSRRAGRAAAAVILGTPPPPPNHSCRRAAAAAADNIAA